MPSDLRDELFSLCLEINVKSGIAIRSKHSKFVSRTPKMSNCDISSRNSAYPVYVSDHKRLKRHISVLLNSNFSLFQRFSRAWPIRCCPYDSFLQNDRRLCPEPMDESWFDC